MIYTVTVLKWAPYRHRTWGYFVELEKAEKSILENWTDMFEMNYYDTAVVEKVPEGVCVPHEVVSWFRANYSDQQSGLVVERTERPEWASQLCNFSFG